MLGKNEPYTHDLTNYNQINNHRPATQGDIFPSINNQSSSSESKDGKCLSISVQFLDDSVTVFKIPVSLSSFLPLIVIKFVRLLVLLE
jgi:hypothetical protein